MRRFMLALALAVFAAPAFAEGVTDAGCKAAVAYSAARRGSAVLALVDGKPVCEGGAPDRSLEIWSGTKSFSGLMLAAAVQDRMISGLDEPVSATLAEWRTDSRKADVTLRQLLSLTSGIHSAIGQVPTYAEAVKLPASTPSGPLPDLRRGHAPQAEGRRPARRPVLLPEAPHPRSDRPRAG